MLGSLLVLAALSAASPASGAPAPWEAAPFQDPKAIAAAAAALPRPAKDAENEVLLREVTIEIDARGRTTRTYRLVWRPFTRGAAEGWARVETSWRGWFQDRPEVRARVVDARGAAHDLDPATLSDAAVEDDDALVYSDERVLRAPLPALDAGVVVEERIVVRDREPMFAAGTAQRVYLSGPARRWRLRVEAPAALPLRTKVRSASLPAPAERVQGDRRILSWDVSPLPQPPPQEAYAPPEDSAIPQVTLSTGTSWAAVGAAYFAIAERQLAGADLRDLAQQIAGPARSREETAARVLAFVAERVRYTGLELGASSLVPAPPAEVLRRGYGDCKDLSLLAVALLRARGLDAHVALLRARWDTLSPELPGIGEVDHAIVHVSGRPALWLDPTAPRTPVGELPAFDQGRLALVADGRAKALEKTPESSSAENRTVVAYAIRMEEDGGSGVVATEEFHGGAARRMRASRDGGTAESAKAYDERRAKEWLVGEALVSASWEGLDGAAPVVRTRTEAKGSRLAVASDATGAAVVGTNDLFVGLPELLRESPKDGKKPEPRKAPVVLPEAHRVEVTFRIVPPAGYRVKSLPRAESIRFGPARYESAYSAAADGTIDARHLFDTGGRRLEAKDAEALRQKIASLTESDGPRVELERTSDALLAQGRGREAIAELQRVAALHPKEASHRANLAHALVQLGMIDAARRVGREAVALDPKSGWAQRSLAWALEHDALGRQAGSGADLAGAIAAMRRARDLEPRAAATRKHLGWLLTHDSNGLLFGPGAALDDAIAEFRYAKEELKDADAVDLLVEALLRAGRAKEALPLARDAKPGDFRNAAVLAASTLVEGPAAAAAEAARLDPRARGAALDAAATELTVLRRYRDAAALLESGAGGTSSAANLRTRASALRRVRPWEEVRFDERSAASLPGRVMVAFVAPGNPLKRIAALAPSARRAELEKVTEAEMQSALRQMAASLPPRLTIVNGLDAALSVLESRDEGEPGTLHRVRATALGAQDGMTVYGVEEGGAWRIAGFHDPSDAPLLGDEIARLAKEGRLEAARRVLGWARGQFAPSGTIGELLRAVAPESRDPASRDDLLRAAAILTGAQRCRDGAPVPRELADARTGADAGAWRALTLRISQCHVAAGRPGDGLAAAREIRARDPSWAPAVEAEIEALRAGKKLGEVRSLAEKRLEGAPKDPIALRTLAGLAIEERDWTTAERWLRAEIAAGEEHEYNELAWMQLYRDPVPREAIDNARRAMQRPVKSRAVAHTLATAHAALGEPAEALQVLRESAGSHGEIRTEDWVVIGRVAQEYGLVDDARAAYARVPKPEKPGPLSVWNLAQAWLGALGQEKGRAPDGR